MRTTTAGLIALLVLLVSCGGSDPSLNDYIEAANAMNAEYSPRGEANYRDFLSNPEPTMDDLRTLLDANVTLRREIQDVLDGLEAPDPIAAVHDRWLDWHSRFLKAAENQAIRADVADDWDEFLNSAEFAEWGNAMREGSELCGELEASLQSTDAQELFAGTPWMPSDLNEAMDAAIGCDSFPDDFDNLATIYGK